MEWITPKTDWQARYDESGSLTGDYVNYYDYNRIKNNLVYVRNYAVSLFFRVPTITVGVDKDVGDKYLPSEFNLIEQALETIAKKTTKRDYGETQVFYGNGRFIGYEELNRLESATLDIYEYLLEVEKHYPRLPMVLGIPHEDFVA